MNTIVLENDQLTVKILLKGAEVVSVLDKRDETEYLWQADAEVWGRHAPVLFPIVGKLKNDEYHYEGQTYQMTQHGFARDMEFAVAEQTATSAQLSLTYSAATLKNFPFKFELVISYQLDEERLVTKYLVKNLDAQKEMYFSIGAHPGFNVPLDDHTAFDDYRIEISPAIPRQFIPVTADVLLKLDEAKLGESNDLVLSRELFSQGVLIFETPGSTQVNLTNPFTKKKISLSYDQLPYLGIWSTYPMEGEFVCIEPWCGIADAENTTGELKNKKGINQLAANQSFTTEYTTSFS